MSKPFELKVPLTALRWFKDSPDAGDDDCLCSWCGAVIDENEFPIRMYRVIGKRQALEARFHGACCMPVFGTKVNTYIPVELEEEEVDGP